jgi:hypothetical protein
MEYEQGIATLLLFGAYIGLTLLAVSLFVLGYGAIQQAQQQKARRKDNSVTPLVSENSKPGQ